MKKIVIWKDFIPYDEYMQSDTWKIQRAKAMDRDGHACVFCGAKKRLEGHHICYDLMGTDFDYLEVITLCHDCHMKVEAQKKTVKQDRGPSVEEAVKKQLEEIHVAQSEIDSLLRLMEIHLSALEKPETGEICRPIAKEDRAERIAFAISRIEPRSRFLTATQKEKYQQLLSRVHERRHENELQQPD